MDPVCASHRLQLSTPCSNMDPTMGPILQEQLWCRAQQVSAPLGLLLPAALPHGLQLQMGPAPVGPCGLYLLQSMSTAVPWAAMWLHVEICSVQHPWAAEAQPAPLQAFPRLQRTSALCLEHLLPGHRGYPAALHYPTPATETQCNYRSTELCLQCSCESGSKLFCTLLISVLLHPRGLDASVKIIAW